MRNSNARIGQSKLSSAEVARSWLDLGIQPVPLQSRSKRPLNQKGWNTLRVTNETIDKFFVDGNNVGGLWGEPSHWVIDVDIDWDEASELAVNLLPETFIYGRTSRPASHFLYRCEGVSGYKRHTGDGDIIVEVRSTGSQSVLPPSIHPDGERYEINHNIPFRTITRRSLEQLVNELAAGAVFIRHYPKEGSRHDYVHALVGALMWSGWTEPKVRDYVRAILKTVSDDDPKQRERTVENTIEHFQKGDRIAGWRTLSQWMPGGVIQVLRRWITFSIQGGPAPVKEATVVRSDEIPKIDPRLLEPPGLVGEVALWAGRRAYLKQPIFNLAVGLMSVAIAAGNKYVVQGWETPIQPYFMLLGPTSSGKQAVFDNTIAFAQRLKMQAHCLRGFQSYYALLDRLAEAPHFAVWLWDEAARSLRSMRANNPEYAVLTWILSLYGQASSTVPGLPGRKNSIPSMEHPYLSIVATAQPSQLVEAVTVSDLSVGLINRFILLDSGDDIPAANLERAMIFPSEIENHARMIKNVEPPKGEYPFIPVNFENAMTWAAFRDFDTEAREQAGRNENFELWGRANQNALILAGLVAVGMNARRPVITIEICTWACDLMRWSLACWQARIGEGGMRTRREGYSRDVERIVRQARKLGKKANVAKYRELMAQGFMPRKMLSRFCRHLNSKDLSDVIDQLVEADLLCVGESNDIEVLWPRGEE